MSKTPFLPAVARAVFTLVLLALAGVASAQSNFPPDRLTYQGFLVDGLGNALATNTPKNYDVIFRIYATQTGTNSPLWGEQQTVTVDKGYFSVLLGEGTVVGTRPSFASLLGTSTNSSDRYVGLTVKGIGAGNADVDILPRLRLLPAPYAFLARSANALVSNGGSNVVTVSGNAVSVSGPLAATSFSGTFTGSAAGLSGLTSTQIPALDASKITSGALADARLSANVALRSGGNTFSGQQTFSGNLQMANATILYGVNSGGNTVECLIPRWSDNATYFNFGTGGLNIRNNAATTRMFVSDSGNVGIGNSSPQYPLSFGSAFGDKIAFRETVPGNPYGIGVQANLLQLISPSSIAFGSGNSSSFGEFMRVNLNGVGIGTNDPSATGKLHIRQNAGVTNFNSPIYAILIDNAGLAQTASSRRGGIRFTDDGYLDATANARQNNPVVARLGDNGTWFGTSDGRMKKDVAPLTGTLEKALRLRPVNYHFTNQTSDESLNMGFIAQEVQREFPSLVSSGGMLTLNYSGFGVVAIGAIQELNQQIKTENKSLRDSLETKDAELQKVKERLAALEELVRQSLGGAKAAK